MSLLHKEPEDDLSAQSDETEAHWRAYEDEQASRFRWIHEQINRFDGSSPVLELGSHPNVLATQLDDRHDQLIAVDLKPSRASDAIRQQLDLRKGDLDAARVPVQSSTVGCVVCSEVLEHLAFPERALDEIRRVLRPDGVGIITTPNYGRLETRVKALMGEPPHRLGEVLEKAEKTGHDGHRQLLSPGELAELSERVGLEVVEQATIQFWPARSRVLDVLYRAAPSLRPYQWAVVKRA